MLAHGEGLHGGVLTRASHESGFVVMRQALPQGRSRKGLDEAMVTGLDRRDGTRQAHCDGSRASRTSMREKNNAGYPF